MKQEISDKKRVFYMKILVLTYGAICLLLAFLSQYLGSILQTSLVIFGVIGGPVLAVFTMGILLPHVNQKVFYSHYFYTTNYQLTLFYYFRVH